MTIFQRRLKTVEEYYKLFNARKDTVNAYGGQAWHHARIYDDTIKRIKVKRSYKIVADATAKAELLSQIKEESMMSSSKPFLVFLCIMMADDGQ